MLWSSKAKADAALAKLNSGTAEAKAATGSIDADTTHGTTGFTAASGAGLMDANFQKAAFQQPNGAWGKPVEANAGLRKDQPGGPVQAQVLLPDQPDRATPSRRGTDAAYAKLKTMVAGQVQPASTDGATSRSRPRCWRCWTRSRARPSTPTAYAPPAALTSADDDVVHRRRPRNIG